MKSPLRLLLSAVLLATSCLAQAQASRPVTLVAASAAGSGTDVAARVLAEELSAALGRTVVVENRPGALGTIGAASVAKAAPDGNTLLMVGGTAMTGAPHLMASMPFRPFEDLLPVTMVAASPMLLLVAENSPARTVGDLVRITGDAKNASYGAHNALNLAAMEALLTDRKIQMEYIQYKGGPQALIDLASGTLTAMFNDIAGSRSMMDARRVRALGVMSRERTALAPEVPTLFEAGYTGPLVNIWTGIFVPAGTPAATVAHLHAEIIKILRKPAVQARMTGVGLQTSVSDSPAALTTYMREETRALGSLLKRRASATQ